MERALLDMLKAEVALAYSPSDSNPLTTYVTIIRLVERLHRQFLELIDDQLDRLGIDDINSVQALILFNIGRDEAMISEVVKRGYYLGSNVSYNVRNLVASGYLIHEKSVHDRRSSKVRLATRGIELYEHFDRLFDQQVAIYQEIEGEDVLSEATDTFRKLGEFWASNTKKYDRRSG